MEDEGGTTVIPTPIVNLGDWLSSLPGMFWDFLALKSFELSLWVIALLPDWMPEVETAYQRASYLLDIVFQFLWFLGYFISVEVLIVLFSLVALVEMGFGVLTILRMVKKYIPIA